MTTNYEARIQRGIKEYGDKFDSSDLDACPNIVHWYNAQHDGRVKVEGLYGDIRFGRISTTSGWNPAWLLIHRSSDIGSSDILGPDDRVIGFGLGGRGHYRMLPEWSIPPRSVGIEFVRQVSDSIVQGLSDT